MNPIASILRTHSVVVLDGALATELERRGCDLRDPLWSAKVLIDAPDLIRAVHADYFASGADCATTATYQATFEGFAKRGVDRSSGERLMRRAVELAVEARDAFVASTPNDSARARPFVAASVGPYGAYLADGSEYRGDYGLTEDELVDFHRPRMAVLADSGAEMLAFETIPSLAEGRALVRLLGEFPHMTAWLSFSARDGAHVSHGERAAQCAAELGAHPQIAAIGVNCTAPRYIASLVRAMRDATDTPVIVYPNSGERYDATTKCWVTGASGADDFGMMAQEWRAAGARVIGGCCRTGPEEVGTLRQMVRGLEHT